MKTPERPELQKLLMAIQVLLAPNQYNLGLLSFLMVRGIRVMNFIHDECTVDFPAEMTEEQATTLRAELEVLFQ